MKEVKKIDFSIGALTTLNSMKENVQDSILAALARVAWQPYFSNTKIKPLNEKENTFIIRPNDDFRLVFKIQNDTIYVTSILSEAVIKSYQESLQG